MDAQHEQVIVVPYRQREDHLRKFLQKMSNHKICIIEQAIGKPFNRGKLLNIGFDFCKQFQSFVFHDVDMLPITVNYNADKSNPVHLAGRVQQFRYKMPYPEYFGGVTVFTNDQFLICNGFSNEYWGWGGEDDELYRRVLSAKMKPIFRPERFISLSHQHCKVDDLHQLNIERLSKPIDLEDGLNSLNYEIIQTISQTDSLKHIIVDI